MERLCVIKLERSARSSSGRRPDSNVTARWRTAVHVRRFSTPAWPSSVDKALVTEPESIDEPPQFTKRPLGRLSVDRAAGRKCCTYASICMYNSSLTTNVAGPYMPAVLWFATRTMWLPLCVFVLPSANSSRVRLVRHPVLWQFAMARQNSR